MTARRNSRVVCFVNSSETESVLKSTFQQNELLTEVISNTAEDCFGILADAEPILVIVEDLPDRLDGVELVRSIRQSDQSPNIRVPILLIINEANGRRVLSGSAAGPNRMLTVPFDVQKCWECIEDALADTRVFVVTDAYVGPERRGKAQSGYSGRDRRLR